MAQNRTDNFNIAAPKCIDSRYLKNGVSPYNSVDEAHALISYKHLHMTCVVLVNGVPIEHWYVGSTASATNLVPRRETYTLTLSQFRASVGLPSNATVTTTDFGSGIWTYVGLNDGQYEDNTGTLIITQDDKVWRRVYEGVLNASWFGISPLNNKFANGAAIQQAIDYIAQKGGGELFFSRGEYKSTPIIVKQRVIISGEGNGHASVYFSSQGYMGLGTVLLIDGQNGDDCVFFQLNTSFSGIKGISIYNDNGNDINSVVNLSGVLYPFLQNVEISSRSHASVGHDSVGLLMEGNNLVNTGPPNNFIWDTLYCNIDNVHVVTNEAVGVRIGLKIKGTAVASRPNAVRFFGGHFQGYSLSLLIDGVKVGTAPTPPQGISFFGTTFESYYNDQQLKVFVPNSDGMQAFVGDQDRYAVIWMHLKQCNQVSFFGCYLEDGGNTFSWDDGIHGVKHAFPCMWVGQEATQTVILGNTLVAGVYDQGFGTTHPNKLSMLDQNSVVSFEGVGIAAQSGLPAGSEARIAIDNVSNLRVRKNAVLIGTNVETGNLSDKLQVAGDITAFQYKHLHTDGDIVALKVGGSSIRLQNENNELSIEGRPIGNFAAHMFFKAEGNEVVEIGPDIVHIFEKVIIDQALKAETPAPEVSDNTVVTAEWVNTKNFSTADEVIAGNSTVLVPTNGKQAMSIKALPEYATDADADADTNLTSNSLYKLTGSRAVYQKP